MEDLKMSKQSQWLFEAPPVFEATHNANTYIKPNLGADSNYLKRVNQVIKALGLKLSQQQLRDLHQGKNIWLQGLSRKDLGNALIRSEDLYETGESSPSACDFLARNGCGGLCISAWWTGSRAACGIFLGTEPYCCKWETPP
jgi:hypothetical protein